MGKNKFYAVKYADNTGLIFTNFDEYKKGIKGHSMSSSKGFKMLEQAVLWLSGRPYKIIDNKKEVKFEKLPKPVIAKRNKKYYAVARGRTVGVIESKEAYKKSVQGYRRAKSKGGFRSIEEAQLWLKINGISVPNQKGIYAVAKGYHTGIFTSLNTYEKNINGYPGAKGKKDFKDKKEAQIWLDAQKIKKKYYVVVKGRRPGIYTDIKKYNRSISGLSDVKAKGGFKSRERAEQWRKEARPKKEYFAIAIGKRRGIYVDRKKYLKNLQGVRNSWGKDGFRTREEARNWLLERLEFIKKYENNIHKEVIIAYESRELPVIYTDGSYMPGQQQYSSAVVICEKNGTIATFAKANKSNKNNIFGEIEAFYYALKIVTDLYDFKEFILVYDFDELERIARGILTIKTVDQSLQEKIVELINENNLRIHFLNVKSHTGIVGNSVADKIAKDISIYLEKFEQIRDIKNLI
ncbi:TPA: viroplasmin family protein [Enterococcus faecium]